jgi:hypothetical protein
MKTNRWLGIALLFILPVVSFFFLQDQSGEEAAWNVAIGMILLGALVIALFCLLWVENIDKSLWPRLRTKISDIFGQSKRKEQVGEDEKDLPQSPISSPPSKPLSFPDKGSMKTKRKENEKKKVNRFESYDQVVEKHIKKAWTKVKGRKDTDAKETMRRLAMQLKTKKYDETDWAWRTINFFRPRSAGLQELLLEIKDRIEELQDEDKQKGKVETGKPTDNLPGDSNPVISNATNPPKALLDSVPSQPDLGKDSDQDEPAEEDNPPNTP